jgi:DNA-binding MarR family transcriptional regulator
LGKKLEKTEILLISLRKITRAVDLHSKQLEARYGLTGPQMLLLKHIDQDGHDGVTNSELAKRVSLSMATITSIIERLEKKGYVRKQRSSNDKRKTYLIATDKCQAVMKKTPSLLQENFISQFEKLHDWEQTLLLSSFERVADMMGVEELDLAPILSDEQID